jgi:UDP-N-acetylmuramoyl-L-alanyl-D-glutamate--2,6-diaminopimelate ligase
MNIYGRQAAWPPGRLLSGSTVWPEWVILSFMHGLLNVLRRIIPRPVFGLYHRTLSWVAAFAYGNPSKSLIVIGVTGTSGKTTTAYLIAKTLEGTGAKVGCLTTALFKVADHEWTNDTKMTMLGRFRLQKLLRDMADAGCTYAVIETSSQGIVQHRHEHIAYDIAVFTNLHPEHIEAHGGFENYKRAKIRLFEYIARLPKKILNGLPVPRIEVLNAACEHAEEFVKKGFEKVVWYAGHREARRPGDRDTGRATEDWIVARDVRLEKEHVTFMVDGTSVVLHMPGSVNVENAMAALATANALGVPFHDAARMLGTVKGLPGRYERINAGQPWTVIVDFAFEPVAVEHLYAFASGIEHGRIIHVLGSAGGGRDAARRPILGRMAGEKADIVIVTNEDPYDDDPREIINQVAEGAVGAGKVDDVNLYRVDDRREAIRLAMAKAEPGDLVLITGKGSEPVMAVAGGKKIPWSDAQEARDVIRYVRRMGE